MGKGPRPGKSPWGKVKEGFGEGERMGHVHAQRKKRRRETKMSGLYREEPLVEGQSNPWARKLRVGARLCQVGTEGY